jgi:hypothetical protein
MSRRVTVRWSAAAVTLTLVVAACTTEEASSPRPTLTSTTSTSSSTTTSTTTTTVAPTTTETPETSAATTTTVPAGPVDAVIPLFIGSAGTAGWLFLGAWQQDRWQGASNPDGSAIRPGIDAGSAFVVSNLDTETPVAAGETVEACFDERVGPVLAVDIPPPDPPGFGYAGVALPQEAWPLKPRPVAATATAPDAYRALGVAAFTDQQVDASQGAVEQLVVADLDGDGDGEALVAFEFVQPGIGPGTAGDLAALLLIDVGTRRAQTIVRTALAQAEPGGAPDAPAGIIERYRVLDVADLNGDGRMEILVHAWYYEGSGVLAFTYDGEQVTEVLATGCGS